MKNKNTLIAGGIGLLTGVMSCFLSNIEPLYFWLGLPFGVITGIYFWRLLRMTHPVGRTLGWVIISGASYFTAVWACIWANNYESMSSPPLFGNELVGYSFAGVVGALILLCGFRILYGKLKPVYYAYILIGGAVIPVLAAWVANFRLSSERFDYLLFTVYQTLMVILLVRGVKDEKLK